MEQVGSWLGILVSAAMMPFERLRALLCDPAKRDRTVAIVLTVYAGVWTLYDIAARASQDIHYDMAEMVAWSRDLAFGGPKHPQMGAWIAALWFWIFPLKDWAFYLLANCMVAVALWVAWKLSEGWLGGNKRAAGLALFTFIPFFNIFAWKYNANTILIPLWALTTFWFFRSLETRSRWAAAFAGIAAACSMMGKYWSIFLLVGLGVAVFASPRRRAYFRSAAPWVTTLVGSLVIAPHLYWVVSHGFLPVEYAVDSHIAKTFSRDSWSVVIYLTGFAAYIAFPSLLLVLLVQPGFAAALDVIAPKEQKRRFVAVAFWAPVLLPVPVALLNHTTLSPTWTMSACILTPIVLLSSSKIRISSVTAARVLMIAAVFSLSALVMAPARALRIRDGGATSLGADYKLLAHAMQKQWSHTTRLPLTIVGSYAQLVYGVSFYAKDRPSILNIEKPEQSPWINNQAIDERGIALVCPVNRGGCIEAAENIARNRPKGLRQEQIITRRYLGVASKSDRFLMITVPPNRAGEPSKNQSDQ